jgi:hypothetical protein
MDLSACARSVRAAVDRPGDRADTAVVLGCVRDRTSVTGTGHVVSLSVFNTPHRHDAGEVDGHAILVAKRLPPPAFTGRYPDAFPSTA